MELILMVGIREESRITTVHFWSGLRYEIWDRVELLPRSEWFSTNVRKGRVVA